MSVKQQDPVQRPSAVPAEGVIDAFDAGWDAHRVGLERETVEVFVTDVDGRGWAIMGWDCRQLVAPDWVPE